MIAAAGLRKLRAEPAPPPAWHVNAEASLRI
jgi:hypothetical protein